MENKKFVGRYRVMGKLGQGGMGLVWRVFDEIENKEVALKEIDPDDKERASLKSFSGSMLGHSLLKKDVEKSKSKVSLSTPSIASSEAELRFSEEFRTMTKLQYPYTVKVFDYGVLDNGNKYITMEIVEGESLKDIIRKRKLGFQEIYKILIQLAQTLNFIHSRLYVHRDIKSENIIINGDGNIKLLDFGLMDRLGEMSDGKVTGTVYYIPPEVFKGGVINESSDLYSLGILAYELVTGKLPFKADDITDVIKMHINTTLSSLKEIRDDMPDEFEKIIFKLLEKEQGQRYQKAPELIQDLSKLSSEKIIVETLEQKKSYLFCSKLIGRESETKKLKDAFEVVKNGQGQSVFISAPAGVGKTRLLQEFKLEVQLSGVLFLEGFCIEQGMSVYQSFKEALKPLISITSKEALKKYGNILVKIIPELEEKGFSPVETLDEFGEKVRLSQNITAWLREISQKFPLVICFEDLHWSDLMSLDLLNSCIRELNDRPIMFLGTFRDDEVDEMSPVFIPVEEGLTYLLKLSLFDGKNTLLLIEEMLGKVEISEEFVSYILKITGGNPFFAKETLKSLIEEEKIKLTCGLWEIPADVSYLDAPDSIGETVKRRLAYLSKEALRLAQIASVMGRELELSALSNISHYPGDKFFEYLDELIERQFIKREGNYYYFTHDRVWETLYSQLKEDEKFNLHETVAEVIEKKNFNNVNSVSSLLAYHYSRGLNKKKAVEYLIFSGNNSLDRAAYKIFTDNYKKAIDILEIIDYPDKEAVLFESRKKLILISYNLVQQVAIDQYFKLLSQLYDLAGGEKKFKKIAKLFQLAFKIINSFPPKIADKIKRKLDKKYPQYQMPKKNDYAHILANIAELSIYYGAALYIQGDLAKQLEVVDDILNNLLPEKGDSINYASVLISRAGAYFGMERFMLVIKETEEAIAIFKKHAKILDRHQQYLSLVALFWHNISCSDAGLFLEKGFQDMLTVCKENNFFDVVLYCYIFNLSDKRFKGKYPEALVIGKTYMDWCKKLGYPRFLYYWFNAYMAHMHIDRGEFQIATKFLEKAKTLKSTETGQDTGWYKFYCAIWHTRQGDLEKGLPLLLDCLDFLGKNDLDCLTNTRVELAEIYLNTGDMKRAAELLNQVEKRFKIEDYRIPLKQTIFYRILGKYHFFMKEYDLAIKSIEKSIEISRDIDDPLHEGEALVSLSEVQMGLTQYNLARKTLNLAKEKFALIDNQFKIKNVDSFYKQMNNKDDQ